MHCCVWVSNLMSQTKGSNRVGCMRTSSWGEYLGVVQAVTGVRTMPHAEEDHNLHPSPFHVRGMRCVGHMARTVMRST